MAKIMAPIIDLKYDRYFPLEAVELLREWTSDDDYTYTVRVSVEDEAERERIRNLLRQELSQQGEELIRLLEETDWDCSFFVDCF